MLLASTPWHRTLPYVGDCVSDKPDNYRQKAQDFRLLKTMLKALEDAIASEAKAITNKGVLKPGLFLFELLKVSNKPGWCAYGPCGLLQGGHLDRPWLPCLPMWCVYAPSLHPSPGLLSALLTSFLCPVAAMPSRQGRAEQHIATCTATACTAQQLQAEAHLMCV
jgi:hypothetical protein